jgi:1-carboxybiuret hydrolase subunit AtzG-like
MADPFEPARYVPLAAAALGLPIAPDDLGDVIGAFAILARVAGPVMAFALPEETIAAAVFVPQDEGRG